MVEVEIPIKCYFADNYCPSELLFECESYTGPMIEYRAHTELDNGYRFYAWVRVNWHRGSSIHYEWQVYDPQLKSHEDVIEGNKSNEDFEPTSVNDYVSKAYEAMDVIEAIYLTAKAKYSDINKTINKRMLERQGRKFGGY